jgi:hypothetical protein
MPKTAMFIIGVDPNSSTECRALFFLEDLLQVHVVTGGQNVTAELVAHFPQASVYVRNAPQNDMDLILSRLANGDGNAFVGISSDKISFVGLYRGK